MATAGVLAGVTRPARTPCGDNDPAAVGRGRAWVDWWAYPACAGRNPDESGGLALFSCYRCRRQTTHYVAVTAPSPVETPPVERRFAGGRRVGVSRRLRFGAKRPTASRLVLGASRRRLSEGRRDHSEARQANGHRLRADVELLGELSDRLFDIGIFPS